MLAAAQLTHMMRYFDASGILWTSVDCTIEMPMLVDSKLVPMVQLADLCACALRW